MDTVARVSFTFTTLMLAYVYGRQERFRNACPTLYPVPISHLYPHLFKLCTFDPYTPDFRLISLDVPLSLEGQIVLYTSP